MRGTLCKLLQPISGFTYTALLSNPISGQPARDFVDSAVRHVLLRQGVLGIKVKIMLDSDPTGKAGPKKPLPDSVTILVGIPHADRSSRNLIHGFNTRAFVFVFLQEPKPEEEIPVVVPEVPAPVAVQEPVEAL